MVEEFLQHPPGEARFWESAATGWQSLGGLLVLLVPPQANRYPEAQALRQLACRLNFPQHMDQAPRLDQTYLLDVTGEPLGDPAAVCRRIVELSEQEEAIDCALRGEQPFYLGLYGASLEGGADLLLWSRGLLQHWFGRGPCARSTQLHLCLIISAPLPDSITLLPETLDVQVFPDSSDEEICAILSDPVRYHWGQLDALIQRYIIFGLADMACSRRGLAEEALSATYDDFSDDFYDLATNNWRLRWRSEHAPVREAARHLADEGLDKRRLRQLLTAAQPRDEELRLIRRLWGQGLWVSPSLKRGLLNGLAPHARAALGAGAESCLLPPCLPASSLDILQRTLRMEQNIKQLLVERAEMESSGAAAGQTIHQALNSPTPLGLTLREQILEKAKAFTWRFTQDAVDNDADLISMCSLGLLPHVVKRITPYRYENKVLFDPLNMMGDIRNYAAHGGWFTAAEFKRAHQQLDALEDKFNLFCSV